jgi:hypothetical protein
MSTDIGVNRVNIAELAYFLLGSSKRECLHIEKPDHLKIIMMTDFPNTKVLQCLYTPSPPT